MQALLLDFGNVVAFFDHRRASRQLAALAGVPTTEEQVFERVFASPLEPDLDRGRIPSSEFLRLLREHLDLAASDDEIVTAWCDIFRPNAELVAQLPRVRPLVHRLVLASNTNDLHFQWIAGQFAAPLALFDELVLSYKVGARKPEEAFFRRCVDAAGVPAGQCVFVDDKPEFVEAARRTGMAGVLYRPGLDLARLVGAGAQGGPA